jgi:hypothetical protein
MNDLATYQIVGCIIALLTLPALLFKLIVRGSKYEPEAHVFLFMLDILFSCALYFGIIHRNPSLSGLHVTAVSLAFFAITYYKTRKFYLHRYS